VFARNFCNNNTTMPKKNMWDSSCARKGELVVRNARTGGIVSSKDATQEQLMEYMVIRRTALVAEAGRRGIDVSNYRGRRWLARAAAREDYIRKQTSAFTVRTCNGFKRVDPRNPVCTTNRELFSRPVFLEGRVGPSVGSREVVAAVKAGGGA